MGLLCASPSNQTYDLSETTGTSISLEMRIVEHLRQYRAPRSTCDPGHGHMAEAPTMIRTAEDH